MKVLNLYAGIGGNRKLWDDVNVTAVEIRKNVAKVYKDHFPQDNVIVADAHEFLEENYDYGWDFIWSSPPCPTHSKTNYYNLSDSKKSGTHKRKTGYPDMKLYQEVILLKNWYRGKYCIENVESYFDPLITPQNIQRHYFWSNFHIPNIELDKDNICRGKIKEWEQRFDYDLSGYSFDEDYPKRKVLRNCVHPKLGKHILETAKTGESDEVQQKELL